MQTNTIATNEHSKLVAEQAAAAHAGTVPTRAQLRYLVAVQNGTSTRAPGDTATQRALLRRGWLVMVETDPYHAHETLTPAGRALLG